MTNAGVVGFPGAASAITAARLAAPLGWGYLKSGNYYTTAQTLGTATGATGTLRLLPWFVPNACTLSRIGGEVTSGGDVGSKYRLGIYADDGTGFPGSLVLDAGQIAGDSATVQEITISQALSPGLYWVGGAPQTIATTQPTVRTASQPYATNGWVSASTPSAGASAAGVAATGITGALPQAFTLASSVGNAIRVFVKVA